MPFPAHFFGIFQIYLKQKVNRQECCKHHVKKNLYRQNKNPRYLLVYYDAGCEK